MKRAASVIEMLTQISELTGRKLNLCYDKVRPGDQPLYIADTTKLEDTTGWRPQRSLGEILNAIHTFWKQNHEKVHADVVPALEQEVA